MFKQPLFWLVLSSALVVTMVTRNVLHERNDLYGYSKDLPEILNLVDRAYVDQVSINKLMPGVFQGAIEAVDQNASYIAPGNEPTPYWDQVYLKWGLVLRRDSGYIQVVAVAPESPAAKAGIFAGNYFRRIGAASTRQINTYQARRDLAAWTTSLKLSMVDPITKDEDDIELELKDFKIPGIVSQKLDGDILLITLHNFYPGWVQDLTQMLQIQLQEKTKLLLDFRNNALGDEQSLKDLASLFLPKGEIIQWRSAETAVMPLLNAQIAVFPIADLFLLVDTSTAWAAELFCGAAQTHGRATIMGHQTLGLPMAYEFIPLKNGGFLQFCLRDAILPGGVAITRKGITPDWEFPKIKTREKDFLLEKALAQLRRAEPQKRKAS